MKLVLAAAVLAAFCPFTALAQSPLNEHGYPRNKEYHRVGDDGLINVAETVVEHTNGVWNPLPHEFDKFVVIKAPEGFVARLREQSVILPNVRSTIAGNWRLKNAPGTVNQKTATQDRVVSVTTSTSFSREVSTEISVGVSVAGTGGFKPFGVGGEITVEASVGFALQLTAGETRTEEWSAQFTVEPGKTLQVWQREVRMKTDFTPSMMFESQSGTYDRRRWSPDRSVGGMSPASLFYVAMFDSYGSVLFPNEISELNRQITLEKAFNPISREQAVFRVLSKSREPGYNWKISKMEQFFSYEGFRQVPVQSKTYTVPTPNYFGTTSESKFR